MLAGLGTVSFERVSLAIIGGSIAALYAIVLIETFAPTPEPHGPPLKTLLSTGVGAGSGAEISTVREFEAASENVDYRLADVGAGGRKVPRLFVQRIPGDLDKVEPVVERKRLFIRMILPLVLYVNETILTDRARLAELRARLGRDTAPLSAGEQAWLNWLRQRYGVEDGSLDELLRRVDIVPPSLALAQAAAESGWGASRFARDGNAVFGEWTFASGTGMVPLRRNRGKRHEVKRFSGLLGSVAAYMMNLNRHPAYEGFRTARETLRRSKGLLDGYELAGTLALYSEKGPAYVRSIRTIIRVNNLGALDGARLEGGVVVPVEPPVVRQPSGLSRRG